MPQAHIDMCSIIDVSNPYLTVRIRPDYTRSGAQGEKMVDLILACGGTLARNRARNFFHESQLLHLTSQANQSMTHSHFAHKVDDSRAVVAEFY